MIFKDNQDYKMVFESKIHFGNDNQPLRFYTLRDISKFHISRYISANAQNIYSESGITPDLLTEICDNMIKAVNERKLDEVSVWVHNIKSRLKYPVDEKASIRMAMIYHFIDNEDPNECENLWTEKKTQLVLSDPEAYSFFLPIGLSNTPSYEAYLQDISTSSLIQRTEMIKQLTPTLPAQK